MTKISKGTIAKNFNATDLAGQPIQLSDFKGQKVLLSFFRKAACPFCNVELQRLIRNYGKLESQGIKVIALFASPKDEILKYAGKQNPPFPIIPDGEFSVYNKYGIEKSYLKMLKSMLNMKKLMTAIKEGFFSMRSTTQDPVIPADFLIDENHKIHRVHYGTNYSDHIPIEELLAWKS